MDTTYFGRGFGVMVLMEASASKSFSFVRQTRNYVLYTEAKIKVDEQNVLHSVKGEKENALTV